MASAGRYREAKMSEYLIDCFFSDFNKYCIPMKLGYDGESWEPEFLPAKYPNILFNPQFSGIGYGIASNICPFNVAEVLDATIKLIKDPKANILLIPDSPTGCDIIDEGRFKEINKTGQSKVTMRATTEIDYINNIIHVTTLPINSTSKNVIDSIIASKAKGLFSEIVEIKDYTKEGEVKIDIFLKSDAKPEKVLKQLYKKGTGLKSTYPVGITVIDDYCEYEYGVIELLLEWIQYRIDIVRSMFLNNLQLVLSKQHMNEVLLMVFNKDNIDTTINIAKTSKSRKETVERLMKKFKITSLQAGVIADMRVYNFNQDSYNNFKEEKVKLKEEVKRINGILNDDAKIEDYIIDELKEGKRKYGRARMSKVVKENDKHNDNIPDTEHLVGISENGFVKKLLLKNVTSIGQVGKTNGNITVLQVNNRENLLVIDELGNVVKISISAIPDMEFEDIGVELKKFFSVKGEIKAVMELPSMELLKVKNDSFGIVFITKNGLAKKVKLSEFSKITGSKSGINLNDGDKLASAIFTIADDDKDIVISTNKACGIRLPMKEIRNGSTVAKGVSMISLGEGEEVVNASIINPKKKLLFYITSSGRVKVTEAKYFPTMNRGDEALSLISLQSNETLLGVASVNKSDSVMVYKKKNEPETLDIKTLDISMRTSKGEKVIKTPRGDSVIGYKIISSK